MTTLQLINDLTWSNLVNKLKRILKLLLTATTPKYKVYTAIFSQAGTSNPTAVELENTIGTITWTRSSEGTFLANSNALFTEGKTWLKISNRDYSYYTEFGQNDSSEVFISAKLREDDTATDDISDISIEIRVYN